MKKCAFALVAMCLNVIWFANARAQEDVHVYGFTGIVYDSVNNLVKGVHRTEFDFYTADYYSPYVCGSLFEGSVEKTRSCSGGIITATRNTQFTGHPDSAMALSDHYVDMYFYDEGTLSYIDYYGYGFLPGNMYPISNYFFAPNIYSNRTFDSIHIGSTQTQASRPTLSLDSYTFREGLTVTSAEKYKIKQQSGTVYLHVPFSASPSATFNNSYARIEVTTLTPLPSGNHIMIDPVETPPESWNPRSLVPPILSGAIAAPTPVVGGATDVVFKVTTDTMNEYLGQLQYRLNIMDSRKMSVPGTKNPPSDMSQATNVNLFPAAGLTTNVAMPPPGKILEVTLTGN